ncbi:MAG: leucyl aminopeptidase family protein [Alphaproteobacteria bacterium]|nr:leucyl aminopeptidase family protein [Alphaproteobacteria bacterium]
MSATFSIVASSKNATPIALVRTKDFAAWLKKQAAPVQAWLKANNFTAAAGTSCLLPDAKGALTKVICGVGDDAPAIWAIAHLPAQLPAGVYALEGAEKDATQMALGWALACYQFTRYKKPSKKFPQLALPKNADAAYIDALAGGAFWARDLINTPANDMNPEALAGEAVNWAKKSGGKVSVIKGEALLKANYPTIYTVGKASSVPPHLVDISFPKKGAPKVTLVGKGVCFDSGGLDIKPSSGMKLMKKDMGGAACVLALAKAIVDTGVKVHLRVLLPIVENAVSGNAMRPMDIVTTRSGITVEIGNTDAEGRLILCDALSEADGEKPDLLIDFATLTGAARVALGADIPAFFTPDDKLADAVAKHSKNQYDPLWRLPLWAGYKSQIQPAAADLTNDAESGYGGAITAALYLQEFVTKTPHWLHVDMMAWNQTGRAGRPQGGEAMAVRALYALIKEKYGC